MISYEALKKIIDEWDPVDLLCTHAPPDEYDSESKEIFEMLVSGEQSTTVEEIAIIIYNIFARTFGHDVFLKSLQDCNNVAAIIFNAIK